MLLDHAQFDLSASRLLGRRELRDLRRDRELPEPAHGAAPLSLPGLEPRHSGAVNYDVTLT